MTGKEKIQTIRNAIDKEYQGLVTGNKIRLYSGAFWDINLEEQKQILDILSKEGIIKYSAKPAYASEDEIEPETLIHIKEESYFDGIRERRMIENLLESLWYDIEVLSGFENEGKNKDVADGESYKLPPEAYDKYRGTLSLSPFSTVAISKRGSAKKKDGSKYFECWLLECVFKNVNTQKTGASFSRILGLNAPKIGDAEKRKIRNAVDAINNKVQGAGGPKNLLKVLSDKVFLNNSYL